MAFLRAAGFLRAVAFFLVAFLRAAGFLRAVAFLRPVVFFRAVLRAAGFLRAVDFRAVDLRAAGLRVLLRALAFFRPVVFFAANLSTSLSCDQRDRLRSRLSPTSLHALRMHRIRRYVRAVPKYFTNRFEPQTSAARLQRCAL